MSIEVSYDAAMDVLHTRSAPGGAETSRTLAGDDGVILNIDARGVTVGVQILFASVMAKDPDRDRWGSCFREPAIPTDMFHAVVEWLRMER